MRAFIIVCVLAVASADKLGYNYRPVSHSASGLSFVPGSYPVSGGLTSATGDSLIVTRPVPAYVDSTYNGAGGLTSGVSSSLVGGTSSGFVSGVGSGLAGGLTSGVSSGASAVNAVPTYTVNQYDKEFYTFTAPEESLQDNQSVQQITNYLKNNLRVIFIVNPENRAVENAALNLVNHAYNQRTAIYVLNKEADLSALTNQLNVRTTNTNSKPEVYFVKYRTSQDAANAQHAIKSHYDHLVGRTASYNGGVAPVLNFASKAPLPVQKAPAVSNAYLPPTTH